MMCIEDGFDHQVLQVHLEFTSQLLLVYGVTRDANVSKLSKHVLDKQS